MKAVEEKQVPIKEEPYDNESEDEFPAYELLHQYDFDYTAIENDNKKGKTGKDENLKDYVKEHAERGEDDDSEEEELLTDYGSNAGSNITESGIILDDYDQQGI